MFVSGKEGKGHNLMFSIVSGTAVLYMFSLLTGRLILTTKVAKQTKMGATAVNVRVVGICSIGPTKVFLACPTRVE